MRIEQWQKCLAFYDSVIEVIPEFERKGKTMPYTSANGHMFSQLNKAGQIGIRLPKELREQFLVDHNSTLFTAYGTVLKEYVLIPEGLHEQPEKIQSILKAGHNYVLSLKPKPTKR